MWYILIKKKVAKDIKETRKIPQRVQSAFLALLAELQLGPQVNWPNYGKLKGQDKGRDLRHCHLQKGKPTWVVCWEVDHLNKTIEIYYVGTHEKAPY